MNPDYPLILASKYPGQEWTLDGDTYDGLTWLSDTPKPTQVELDALWPQVAYETQVAKVENNRLVAYEQTSDPIFFKWQRGDATEAEWREAVAKVKLDNPYPPAP